MTFLLYEFAQKGGILQSEEGDVLQLPEVFPKPKKSGFKNYYSKKKCFYILTSLQVMLVDVMWYLEVRGESLGAVDISRHWKF